ncbi:hypothetical protein Ahy_B03g062260 isoform C [Arachis hypogaea]|uniref:Ras-related protein n=1 Tax=Arachis hypogaea TaxID=3818 RepID=A0A444ZTI8_ARAHY|nr:hypothetical protein Ahy_B03g062260 isoform C [Arachis hypogaea]
MARKTVLVIKGVEFGYVNRRNKWVGSIVNQFTRQFRYLTRQVSIEEGEAKTRELEVMFIETSAKAGFNIKPLFRKIAAALPGMDSLSSTKQEDMVDVNLKSTGNASQADQQGGGCAC